MANREVDARSGEFYWRQSEILIRFEGLRDDFNKMVEVHVDIAMRNVKAGRWELSEAEAYVEGVEDMCTNMAACLEDKFPEISRNMK